MILTKKEILKRKRDIVVKPFNINNVNANSIDLTLNPNMYFYTEHQLDAKLDNPIQHIVIPEEGYVLMPNMLYIARTNEHTETLNHVPMLADKSSLARLGLSTHFNAGFGDNGFRGTWTLEMTVIHPLRIYPNMKICQIYYQTVPKEYTATPHKDNLYQGKYQDQVHATTSRSWIDSHADNL